MVKFSIKQVDLNVTIVKFLFVKLVKILNLNFLEKEQNGNLLE